MFRLPNSLAAIADVCVSAGDFYQLKEYQLKEVDLDYFAIDDDASIQCTP